MFLKQSTAATIVLGPFVDDVDGKTAETALSIAQADVRLSKNAGTFAQKSDSGSCSHMENGYYSCALNTTDTNTLGRLRVAVSKSGALPVWADVTILSANVYDSLIGGGDRLQVHADEMTANLITSATIATGAIDADAVATDAVTEIQSGLATSSALSTVAGYIDTEVAAILAAVDTEVAAIKAKTDNLPSDPADQSAVEAAITAALAAIGLDHLVSASVAGSDVVDNSIIARLVSKGATADWDTFNNTTDSLEARADDKAGYSLAATGLDAVTVPEASTGAEPTSLTGLIRMIYNRHFRRAELTDSALKTYTKDAVGGSSGVLTNQSVSDDGTTQIQQQATYP